MHFCDVIRGENRIAKDVDLTALLRYHTPPCDRNQPSEFLYSKKALFPIGVG
jgi:hypothetical protein